MSEVDSSPQNFKIPDNWQFQEKSISLPVLQIDLSERYLALRRTYPKYPEETEIIDYFFDRQGLTLMARSFKDFSSDKYSVDIKKKGEIQVEYSFSYHEPYTMSVSFFNPEETSMSTSSFVANPMDGIFFSTDGRSAVVRMARPWIKDSPNPPGIDFSNEKNEFIKRDWDCYKIFDRGSFRLLDQDQSNKLVFVNREGRKEYVVVWDTVMEETREGRQAFFVLTQSHFDVGSQETRKILKSPLQINIEEVKTALLSKPPYPKDDKGRLVVPWRDIDRLVGARLSYSYPPQKPS